MSITCYVVLINSRSNGFKLREGRFKLDIRKKFVSDGGETLERVAQRGSGGPIPRNIQGQVGRALSSLIYLKMSLLTAGGLG